VGRVGRLALAVALLAAARALGAGYRRARGPSAQWAYGLTALVGDAGCVDARVLARRA